MTAPATLRDRAAVAYREATERARCARDEEARQHAARLVEKARSAALELLGVTLTPAECTVTLGEHDTLHGAAADFSVDGLDFRVARQHRRGSASALTPEWQLFWVRTCTNCGDEREVCIGGLDDLGARLAEYADAPVHPLGCPAATETY